MGLDVLRLMARGRRRLANKKFVFIVVCVLPLRLDNSGAFYGRLISKNMSLRSALKRWELLRLPYNLVIFGLTLFWSWPLRETMKEEALLGYWGSVAAYLVTANVFYTLGPALESYWQAFRGKPLGKARLPLFLIGGLASTGMTWTYVWSMEILYLVLYPSRPT